MEKKLCLQKLKMLHLIVIISSLELTKRTKKEETKKVSQPIRV